MFFTQQFTYEVVQKRTPMEIMPRHSCAKFLSRYLDFCHTLHFFLLQSFVDWVAMERLPFGFRWQGNVPIQYARSRSVLCTRPPPCTANCTSKNCEQFAEMLLNLCENRFYCASDGREHFAEILRKSLKP